MQLWDNKGADSLYLFTPEELKKLPDGIVLESIMGDFKTKGKDYMTMIYDSATPHMASEIHGIMLRNTFSYFSY